MRKTIPGFSAYEITDTGELWRVLPSRTGGEVPYKIAGSLKCGYRRTQIMSDDGEPVCCSFHRLVLLAFVGEPPPDKPNACHRNDVGTDNRVENLYWGSGLDNHLDLRRNHDASGGYKQWKAKLTPELVRAMRAEYSGKYGQQKQLAKKYGVSVVTAKRVLLKYSWRQAL